MGAISRMISVLWLVAGDLWETWLTWPDAALLVRFGSLFFSCAPCVCVCVVCLFCAALRKATDRQSGDYGAVGRGGVCAAVRKGRGAEGHFRRHRDLSGVTVGAAGSSRYAPSKQREGKVTFL